MQNSCLNILALGDVVGDAGTSAVCKAIPRLKKEHNAHMVIVNVENCAETYGTCPESAQAILDSGADVLTGGNHSLKNYGYFRLLEENYTALRPINLPSLAPGKGHCIWEAKDGTKVLVISAMGQAFMERCDSPFAACDRLLNELKGKYDIAVCDLHGEATGEKAAFARYFDGRIQVIFGTHTHVQTADSQYFEKGSGFVTDIGMCGVTDSILGVKSDVIIEQFTTGISKRYEKAKGTAHINGVLFTVSTQDKTVKEIKHIQA